ncbi:MAG TPA: cysteine desulfurase family protein, partial [Polyangia bacterium]|nr:cysteine desulfurase family protein [Polyangia bacterium]
MIYFDHNATSPLREGVAEAMARALRTLPGNPSSVHAAGRQARAAVEDAREQVARFLGVLREEIVFTSGGTEGDNLVIRSLAQAAGQRGRRHLITSPLEHPAVGGALEALAETGFAVTRLPVGTGGELAVDALASALRDDTGLVSLALANHELGNVYPIAAMAQAAHARGALFHTDAVQAAGKRALDLSALGVDAATISAHKLGGPKAVGAVFVRRGLDLPPLLRGGHQERERRPGTENVPGIVGFGLACQLVAEAQAAEETRLLGLRERLEAALLAIEGARLFGVGETGERLAGTTLVGFAGAPGQLVAIGLDLEGICVSTGAACTSGSLKPSPVLLAMGFDPAVASEGVRISL